MDGMDPGGLSPTFFYLFEEGKNLRIVALTTAKASLLWEQGRRWVGVPQPTRAESEQLRDLFSKLTHEVSLQAVGVPATRR